MGRGAALAMVLACWLGLAHAESRYPGVGRAATPAEVKAWDIDVRPDFKGLPAGSGSVAQGQKVWDDKCASCHGTFGESNEVFTPLVGGTSAEDIKAGRVKSLTGGEQRTTLMKLATVSTLWDYVNRAMPWNAPKTLSTEEVYAVVAYLLHLGDILPADFVLSDRNIAQVQERLPNRKGMTREHGLWDVKGKADVRNVACMKDCTTEPKVASAMPEYAAGDHGNLAEQHRGVGPTRGTDGNGTKKTTLAAANPGSDPQKQDRGLTPQELARTKACLACHGVDKRLVGPSFKEVAARYKGQADAESQLLQKLRRGSSGTWGPLAMPPNPDLAEADARALLRWILAGPG
jgi:cytochrome c551/c552/cytochrome c5